MQKTKIVVAIVTSAFQIFVICCYPFLSVTTISTFPLTTFLNNFKYKHEH